MGEDDNQALAPKRNPSRRDFIGESAIFVGGVSLGFSRSDVKAQDVEHEPRETLQEVLYEIKKEIEERGGDVYADVWIEGVVFEDKSIVLNESAGVSTQEIIIQSDDATRDLVYLYTLMMNPDIEMNDDELLFKSLDLIQGNTRVQEELLLHNAEKYKEKNPDTQNYNQYQCFNSFLEEIGFSSGEGVQEGDGKGFFLVSSLNSLTRDVNQAVRNEGTDINTPIAIALQKYEPSRALIDQRFNNRMIFQLVSPSLTDNAISRNIEAYSHVWVRNRIFLSDNELPSNYGEVMQIRARDNKNPEISNDIGIAFWASGINREESDAYIVRIFNAASSLGNGFQILDIVENDTDILTPSEIRRTLSEFCEIEETPLSDLAGIKDRSIVRMIMKDSMRPALLVSEKHLQDPSAVHNNIPELASKKMNADLVVTLPFPQTQQVNPNGALRPKNFTVGSGNVIVNPDLTQNTFRESAKTNLKYVQFNRETVGVQFDANDEEKEILKRELEELTTSLSEYDLREAQDWLDNVLNEHESESTLPPSLLLSAVLDRRETLLYSKLVNGTGILKQIRDEVGFLRMSEEEQVKWHDQSFNGLGGYVQAAHWPEARIIRGREFVLNALCAMDNNDRSVLTMTLAFDLNEWEEIYKNMRIVYPEGITNWPTVNVDQDGNKWVDLERMFGKLVLLVNPEGSDQIEIWTGGEKGDTEMRELVDMIRSKHSNATIYFGDQNLEPVLGVYTGDEYKFAYGPGFNPSNLKDVHKRPPYSPLPVMPAVCRVDQS